MHSTIHPQTKPEENKPLTRQSLPSIYEVISGTSTPCSAPALPFPAQHNNNSPSPFLRPSRSSGEVDQSVPPPPGTELGVRRNLLLPLGESPREAFDVRSDPAFPARGAPPLTKTELAHPSANDALGNPGAINEEYSHATAPPSTPAPCSTDFSAPLPQGQKPLLSQQPFRRYGSPKAYPDMRVQSRHSEAHRLTISPVVASADSTTRSYEDTLGRPAQSARATFQLAEVYGRTAEEQHGPRFSPERLPIKQEATEMFSNYEMQRVALGRLREATTQSIRNRRSLEPPIPQTPVQDEQDGPKFEEGAKIQHSLMKVKTRRGRSVPGSCHNCNRIKTPEWRKGPDGARTLCNACGLRYAKVERKRQIEQRKQR